MPLLQGSQNNIGSVVGCLCVSTIAIILCIWCKLELKAGLHADDAFILITQASWYSISGLMIWDFVAGAKGRDVPTITAELHQALDPESFRAAQVTLKVVWFVAVFSFIALYTIKMAILLLCRRIFSVGPYRNLFAVLMAVSTAMFISVEVANIVHCMPIESFWELTVAGGCFNFNLFNLIAGVLDIVLDGIILAVPIWAVYHTRMPLKLRLLVCGIFLVGGFAIVTNILRLKYTYQPNSRYGAYITETSVSVRN
ncbi:hypothetical protein GGR52DRAFT_105726 [Hypoxylon sp. FL1284]|nr:hypothetical protein GGR52DRAFT_105726 [Hypoxylon sp. FL1284]